MFLQKLKQKITEDSHSSTFPSSKKHQAVSTTRVSGKAPFPRRGFSVCAHGNGIYFFGGMVNLVPMNDVVVMSLSGLSSFVNPLAITGTAPTPRVFHTATNIKGKVYVFGGIGSNGSHDDGLYCLNLGISGLRDTKAWSRPRVPSSHVPIGRHGHAAAAVKNQHIFYFGGQSADGYFNDFHLLNVNNLRFESLPVPVSICNRAYHSLDVWQDLVLVLFGGECGYDCMDDIWAYDTIRNTWSEVKPLSSARPCARYMHGSFITHNYLVIVGGKDVKGKALNDIWAFNLAERTWALVGELPRLRAEHFCCLVKDKAYIFGGFSDAETDYNSVFYIELNRLKLFHSSLRISTALTPSSPRAASNSPKSASSLHAPPEFNDTDNQSSKLSTKASSSSVRVATANATPEHSRSVNSSPVESNGNQDIVHIQKVKMLEREVLSKKQEVSKLKTSLENMEAKNVLLEQSKNSYEMTMVSLQERVQNLELELSLKDAQLNVHEDSRVFSPPMLDIPPPPPLSNLPAPPDSHVSSIDSEKEELESQITELMAEHDKTILILDKREKELDSLRREIKLLTNEKEKLLKVFDEKKRLFGDIQVERDRLQEQLEHALSSQKFGNKELEEEIKSYQQQVKILQKQLDEKIKMERDYSKSINNLNLEIDSLKLESKVAHEESQSLLKDLTQSFESKNELLKKAELEVKQLKQEIAQFHLGKSSETIALSSEIESLKASLKDLVKRNQEKDMALNSALSKITDYESQIGHAKEYDEATLKQKQSEHENELKSLEVKISQKIVELKQITETVEGLKQRNAPIFHVPPPPPPPASNSSHPTAPPPPPPPPPALTVTTSESQSNLLADIQKGRSLKSVSIEDLSATSPIASKPVDPMSALLAEMAAKKLKSGPGGRKSDSKSNVSSCSK